MAKRKPKQDPPPSTPSTQTGRKNEADETLKEIESYSRAPFRRILSDLVVATPGVEELRTFARKAPDRHAQSMAIVGKLAGFSEKLEIDGSLAMRIDKMCDSQLIAAYNQLRRELKEEVRAEIDAELASPPALIDVTPDTGRDKP
jgi:hypothetical protein